MNKPDRRRIPVSPEDAQKLPGPGDRNLREICCTSGNAFLKALEFPELDLRILIRVTCWGILLFSGLSSSLDERKKFEFS